MYQAMRLIALALMGGTACAACGAVVENGVPTRATLAADDLGNAPSGGHPFEAAALGTPTVEPGVGAQAPEPSASGKRYVVLGRRSRLVIRGHDDILGDHVLSFARWWANIEGAPPRIVVKIDVRSLRSDEGVVASIVKDHLLEADRYPYATLTGSLNATSRADELLVDGVASVHGESRPMRFLGKLREQGDGFRFHASFEMSRSAFGLRYAPIETILDDTFRVTVDAVATPERVQVEEE